MPNIPPPIPVKKPYKSALDYLNEDQISSLTDEAKSFLSKVPVVLMNNDDYAGTYTYLNKSPYRAPAISGAVYVDPNSGVPISETVLHESLHAWDDHQGFKPGYSTLPLPPGVRDNMFRRYNYGGPEYANENHIVIQEAYAAGGEQGQNNVPPVMRKAYSGFFKNPGGGKMIAKTYKKV